jgi:LPS export ABC transporter protein LptC
MNTPSLLPQRLSLGLGLLIILLIGVFWESGKQTAKLLTIQTPDYIEERADIYLKNLEIKTYNTAGMLISTTQSKETRHYPENNTTLAIEPRFHLNKEGKYWQINAASALEQNDVLHLTGQISAIETASGLTISAEQMLWENNIGMLSSDGPVTIQSKNGSLHANGFDADLNKQRYRLHSNVKGELHSES